MQTTLAHQLPFPAAGPVLAAEPARAPARPRARVSWAGRVLSGLPSLFLAFDAGIKLANLPVVAKTSERLGIPAHLGPGLGVLLAVCLALYLVPRTAALGAVLLTGYLGGAVLVHLRVGDPLFSHTLFPVYVGAMLWAGLWLRDDRVRRLLAPR
ncbi:MAG TPA: DoxX family protein [Kofleriaceae bacterium]|nr:DoxX family protein [Kofleriaceae bacterium]